MNTVKVRNLELGNGIPAICIPNVGKTKEDILSLTRTYLDMHMDLMECRRYCKSHRTRKRTS